MHALDSEIGALNHQGCLTAYCLNMHCLEAIMRCSFAFSLSFGAVAMVEESFSAMK